MNEKTPNHVGVILDGNRRFARRLMLRPWKGHEWGAKKVKAMIEWCEEFKVNELTFYALSVENFATRPKEELNYLFDLFRKEFNSLIEGGKLNEEKRVKINFVGRLDMFPSDMQEMMNKLMDMTKDYGPYQVNFALAYGGRAEIVDAVKKVAEGVKKGEVAVNEINEEIIDKNVYNPSKPDLIIRTSGEKRISGFLLWQSAYSEFAFVDKYWPEFEKQDFANCLADYSKRERRFGK